jgi:hypothetical protein
MALWMLAVLSPPIGETVTRTGTVFEVGSGAKPPL